MPPRKTPQEFAKARTLAFELKAQNKSLYYIIKACGVHRATIQKWFAAGETPLEAAKPLDSYLSLGVEGLIEARDIVCREDNTLWQVRSANPKDYPSGWSAHKIEELNEAGTLLLGEEVKDLQSLWLKSAWSEKNFEAKLPLIREILQWGQPKIALSPRSIVRATYSTKHSRQDYVGTLEQITEIVVKENCSRVNIDSGSGSVTFHKPEFATGGVPDPDKVAGYLMAHGCEDVVVDYDRLKSHIKYFAEGEPKGLTRADLENISTDMNLPTWYPAAENTAREMGYRIF
jgi:hypothetical protein